MAVAAPAPTCEGVKHVGMLPHLPSDQQRGQRLNHLCGAATACCLGGCCCVRCRACCAACRPIAPRLKLQGLEDVLRGGEGWGGRGLGEGRPCYGAKQHACKEGRA